MAENLKEVIARLKAQQNSQTSRSTPAPAPKPAPIQEDEEYNAEDDEEEQETVAETPKTEEKPIESKINPKNKQNTEDQQRAIIQQVEALQNNGVYRIELLGALDDIKRSLVVIAGVLVDIAGVIIDDKKQK